MAQSGKQVFYDPTGRRSQVVRGITLTIVLAILGLTVAFFLSVLASPALPSIDLRIEDQFSPMAPDRPWRSDVEDTALDLKHRRTGTFDSPAATERFAFFVNWDENSFISLRNHASDIDVLIPEWLHLTSDTGDIALDDPKRQNSTAFWLSVHAPKMKVMPLINNYDPKANRWLGEETGRMLRNPKARRRFIRKLKAALTKANPSGVVLDFKMLGEADEEHLIKLVTELKRQLAPAGQRVFVVVPVYQPMNRYHELTAAADKIILLAYDQHWTGDISGPLASQGWFEAQLDKRFATTVGSKIVVAIGSYAIDWRAPGRGRAISVRSAWDLLRQSRTKLAFHPQLLNPSFSYKGKQSRRRHTVWMLDGVTVYNQVAAALAMKPAGLALWRLGTEDPTVWHSFARERSANAQALQGLQQIDPGDAVVYNGEGEVLKFKHRQRTGKRTLQHVNDYNLIVQQSIVTAPRALTIERWGRSRNKLIALTFDDGPSPLHTAKVLDILARKRVQGSFFVVGAAAAMRPDLLERIYNEGHDIGNHTFTHPDLSAISGVQLDLELNATQRVLESKLGIHSVLFRPPFLKNIEPTTNSQANTLRASSALGYITIGQRIDPLDWGRPGADEIVSRTIDYTTAERGNIVLLHDGGGDRSQTIEALPRIIDDLRAKGFRFVTVHELLGLKRDDLMPRIGTQADYLSWFNSLSLTLATWFALLLGMLFVIGILCGSTRLALICAMAVGQARISRDQQYASQRHDISVIVPAFNEAKVIIDCIVSLLQSNRKDFNVLVVDDGSTDETAALVKEHFGAHPRVRLLVKSNGGKSSALNHGILHTASEILVCIDADTRLEPDALDYLLVQFSDAKVGAVAGVVSVGNRNTLLARFQAIEYTIAQNLDRRALEYVGGVGVVPGAIGAWRREAVLQAGLFGTDTLAEDADLTIALQKNGWLVRHEGRARSWTEAPATISEFRKQRFRWMFGTLQVACKHLDVYAKPGAWGLKIFTLPNIFLFQFLFTVVSPLMDAALIWAITSEIATLTKTTGWSSSAVSSQVIAYWALFQTMELLATVLAFKLGHIPLSIAHLGLVVLQRFCYRQLLYLVAIEALFAAMLGRLNGWGKLRRSGLKLARARRFMGPALQSRSEPLATRD